MSVPARTWLALRTAMERCGFTIHGPAPSSTRLTVSDAQWDALWEHLNAAGAQPEVVLELATALPVGIVAPLDLALVTAPTTREALTVLSLGWSLVGSPGDHLELSPTPAGLRVTVRHSSRTTDDPFGDAFALAVVLARLRQQSRRSLRAMRCGLQLELSARSRPPFERFFGCRVEASADAFVELTSAAVSTRQVTADPAVHALLRAQVQRAGRSLPDEVMAETRRWLSRGAALEDVARARGETGRTLQRRLAEVGLTWRRVRDAVREDEAKFMLEHGAASLPEVAEALGFADQAVFSRAFSRWTGQSPTAWRREARSSKANGGAKQGAPRRS
ncbi:MAG: AraC family transcriptional regulator [Myxococcaceae bacterium]|jgi:AraC-like DNA-binding protein|nr:AraC family transcriptional regulator [Myxococcaceae bacterium]